MRNLKQDEKELLINLFKAVKDTNMTPEEKAKHIWPEALKQCKGLMYATKKQSVSFLVDWADQPVDEVEEAVEDLNVQLTATVEPATSNDKEEAMFTVKDLADELGITPYKTRVALRKAFGKAKGRWQWSTEEAYQEAVDAIGGDK